MNAADLLVLLSCTRLSWQQLLVLPLCVLVLGGCAITDDAETERLRLAREAEKAALAEAIAASQRAQTPPPSQALQIRPELAPLHAAVRRLVPTVMERAIDQQPASSGSKLAMILPARSFGLQPPSLGVSGIDSVARAHLIKTLPNVTLIDPSDQLNERANWAILMDVTLADQDLLCVRVLDFNSGRVLAAERQQLKRDSIKLTPIRYFRDLPVVLTWPDVLSLPSSCQVEEVTDNDTSNQAADWRARVNLLRVFDQAASLYARRNHQAARERFRVLKRLAEAPGNAIPAPVKKKAALHGRLGEYLSTWRMIFNRGAEHLMQPLVAALFDQNSEVALNLAFSPRDGSIDAGRRIRSRQTEWLIEVSRFLRALRACADIVGHATNDFVTDPNAKAPIGMQHAEYVRRQLRRHSKFDRSDLVTRLPLASERMPIALTGDIRDEWARRVSIVKRDCR